MGVFFWLTRSYIDLVDSCRVGVTRCQWEPEFMTYIIQRLQRCFFVGWKGTHLTRFQDLRGIFIIFNIYLYNGICVRSTPSHRDCCWLIGIPNLNDISLHPSIQMFWIQICGLGVISLLTIGPAAYTTVYNANMLCSIRSSKGEMIQFEKDIFLFLSKKKTRLNGFVLNQLPSKREQKDKMMCYIFIIPGVSLGFHRFFSLTTLWCSISWTIAEE